jgi:hypothetical protein
MSLGELHEAAIIATIIDRVSGAKRFCGETFIQKSTFFLKELFGVPFAANFRLYHYGPFSFDLRSQLQSMEADGVVNIRPHEFGATYVTGERYQMLRTRFPKTIATHEQAIRFVIRELAPLGVKDLEPLATALFLTRQHPDQPVEVRAGRLNTIKPHIEIEQARKSVVQIDHWFETISNTSPTR